MIQKCVRIDQGEMIVKSKVPRDAEFERKPQQRTCHSGKRL